MELEFDCAYSPFCAYNAHWVYPLPPRQNLLSVAIEAGEKVFHRDPAATAIGNARSADILPG